MKPFTLYAGDRFSRAFYVIWMLEECGADYDIVRHTFDGSMKAPEYLAINPMGKVPALKHNGAILTETAAILTHLADLHPEKNLIPAVGSPERGQYYRLLMFATHLEYAILDRRLGTSDHPRRRMTCGYGDYDSALAQLRAHLQGKENLIGGHFSALDLCYTGLLYWGVHATQTLPAEPPFTDYIQRHTARPAFRKTMEIEPPPGQ